MPASYWWGAATQRRTSTSDDQSSAPDDNLNNDDDSAGDDDDLPPGFHIEWPEEFGYLPGEIEASTLAFGSATTGSVADIPVSISNPGLGQLEICESYVAVASFDADGELITESVTPNAELDWSGPSSLMSLEAGGVLDSPLLRFTPLYGTPLEDNLYLVVKHELNFDYADNSGTGLYIPITGQGDGQPVPDIVSTPATVEFPDLLVGEFSAVEEVQIANVGPGQLEIGTAYLQDNAHFTLASDDVSGLSLASGESGLMGVQFIPASEGNHSTILVVPSNDPDEDPLQIPLTGTADPVYTGKGPQAVCAVDFDSAPFSTEQFDGSDSFDPDGLVLTFSWVLTPPPGSASTLSSFSTPEPTISLDLAGDYSATLSVTNTAGQSDSCTQVISEPPRLFRRPQKLRDWGHHEVIEEVFCRGPGARRPFGWRGPEGLRLG
ncbi:MAG: choice-of-anchor D domain-containing protein, partial [Proteobacteria bacterium]|nr:choice-of-anchor D domain-containing protein [Pseudomonadota bacterium]